MSITVNNISKAYGPQLALNNVSFSIGSNEVVGFLGPNGAGKSTMMKILTCFISPTDGTAEVCGFDIRTAGMEVRRNVGYLPEHNPLYLDMYVREYLAFVAGVHKLKDKDARVTRMVETVGLGREQHKKIGALSKGYRQRVGLAQAMIHDPQVLILDEPTSGLDPNQLDEVRGLIKRIGSERTVMLSTHIMQEVEAICERVIIIDKGNIVANDSAERLRSTAGEQEGLHVELEGTVTAADLLGIPGITAAQQSANGSWTLLHAANTDVRAAIFQFAVAKDLKVLGMQKAERGLEQVFKELTKG